MKRLIKLTMVYDSRYVQCEQAGMPFSEGFRLVYYMAKKTRQIRGLCP